MGAGVVLPVCSFADSQSVCLCVSVQGEEGSVWPLTLASPLGSCLEGNIGEG